ncbi:MAG: carbamoyltransferase HypF, partial [Euryarchaeota archaeon]|nr:carbamoyltransferase HypF [Euryarchaeota archaeon]
LERYGAPTEFEKRILTSSHRPVVLIKKRDMAINELIAPGLGNIGAFLPYTGMHHVLFHHLESDAVVMTSANVPGEPMVLRDADAIALKADCYLLHNREIINRCDDSVLRTFEDKTFFIRKSRGHIPSSIDIGLEGTAVGLGAQENISGAISKAKRMYQTQYIGDGSSIGVMDFLESAIHYHRKLLGVERIEAVGIDLHPAYATRRLGKSLSERWGSQLVEVQHHWAHAASLVVDAGMKEIVALTLDGTGYGADGKLWGGEILHADYEGYDRIGHLQEIPLLGGEKAVRDPRRIVFALSEMAGRETAYFDEGEAEVLRKMMKKSVVTTSFGRILDALSCHFDICCSRTYEGEPAMKLERHIESGKRTIDYSVERKGNVVHTVPLFQQLLDSNGSADDKARSFVHALLEAMVDIAAEEARNRRIESIGITGGVSYNHAISLIAKELIEARGFRFVCHNTVSNGDGGISTGQCAIALASQK